MTDQKKDQQITIIKSKTTRVVNRANDLTVSNQQEFEEAANILTDMKSVLKEAEKDRTSITKPLNDALKKINEKYKPMSNAIKDAEKIVKKKLADYQAEVQKELDRKEEKLRKDMVAGNVSPEQAVEQMENQESIGTSHDTKRGSVQFKKVKKVRITDMAKVPVKYFNDPKVIEALTSVVRQDALDGVEIAGVEVYEESQVAAR